MDKQLVLAVAGSGKTRSIVERLTPDSRAIIVTYTTNNADTLRSRILAKFGVIPENVKVLTYFTFVYNFCYLPIFQLEHKNRGIIFDINPPKVKGVTAESLSYYQSRSGYLYSQRLAMLLNRPGALTQVIQRLEEFYDYLVVDEIQDFGSHDIELLLGLAKARVNVLFVGDYYQHTFIAGQDGAKGRGLYKTGYEAYVGYFRNNSDLVVDTTSLQNSWRCSPTICQFVTDKLEIGMGSNLAKETSVSNLFDSETDAKWVLENHEIKKLFLQKSYDYNCSSANWGESKGSEFPDVCVVFSDEMAKVFEADKPKFAPMTRSKLYVALTRSQRDLYFVRQKHADYLVRS